MTPVQKSVGILVLSAATVLGTLALSKGPARTAMKRPGIAPAANTFVTLESSHALRGLTETHAVIRVKAPSLPGAQQRPPVSVAVVLDRSGSMHGEKLAQAKRAAVELVSALTERDHVSFTIYGTEVETLVRLQAATAENKRRAIDVINSITDDGGTNLSGGMLAGRAELERRTAESEVRRVVLISDGRANEGVVYRDQLAELARQTAERGISITTLGVGLDFEEQTMTAIAVAGRGNYYYAEEARDMTALFRTELGRVAKTTATNVSLAIDNQNGVEVLEAYGYQVRGGVIELADLHAGEERAVVLRLRVRSEHVGTMPVLRVSLAMTDPLTGETHHQPALATVEITDDHQAVIRGQDAGAIRAIERARTARSLQTATEMYERGDAAGARRVLEQRRVEAQKRAAVIGAPDLAAEIDGVANEAEANFKPAAPSSAGGKAGRKRNRKKAYDLLY